MINSSLWLTMKSYDLPVQLIDKMEGVFQWSLDFFRIQNGDQFKIIYEENTIDGKFAGIGKVLGAYFKNYDNEYYGIYYENGKAKGYYDEEGRPMKSPFLKAPIRFSSYRISSSYNLRRFHPVLKRVRPHYGTDYAAPRGTPIVAVAHGVVTRAGYGRGNGNYVKIKHDKTYSTQYLHMSGFAKGIRSGVHVKQGQVIGYVGSTGLATGPHVCFRFWKNGKQVNHLRLKLPNPEPMPENLKPLYFPVRDEMVARLGAISYPALEVAKTTTETESETAAETAVDAQ
jgi:murein DD-endopeptidase MepM/ murein hydrolase activator NlpD